MKKTAVKTKTETKTTKKTKVQVEPGKRVEETIVIQRKTNPYIDNYSYRETKNILNKNPRFQVIVEHKRFDHNGAGNFEQTSSERKVFSQGGNRPNLPDKNQKLRANKSEAKVVKEQVTKVGNRSNKPANKNPVSAQGKKEKIQETTVKRRSEGTGTKTETKTSSQTTKSGVRGQDSKTSTSTKTTTKTTKIGGGAPAAGAGAGAGAGATSIRRKFGKK